MSFLDPHYYSIFGGFHAIIWRKALKERNEVLIPHKSFIKWYLKLPIITQMDNYWENRTLISIINPETRDSNRA